MRIDRYLHCIRLVKSRTLAGALVEEGHVRVDGKRVLKPSEAVKVGSVIALPLHDQVRILRVLALPERRRPASEARCAYEEIAEKRVIGPSGPLFGGNRTQLDTITSNPKPTSHLTNSLGLGLQPNCNHLVHYSVGRRVLDGSLERFRTIQNL